MSTRAEFNAANFSQLQILRRQGRTAEAREVRRELIRRNIGIAKMAGRKFEQVFEVAGARLIAFKLLGMSVDTFDPGTGRPFTRFAVKFIRRQLLRLWRRQREREAAQAEPCIYRMDGAELAELLDRLDPFQRNVVTRRFGLAGRKSQSCAEIGRDLSLPGGLVQRHLRRAIQQLREFAQDDHQGREFAR